MFVNILELNKQKVKALWVDPILADKAMKPFCHIAAKKGCLGNQFSQGRFLLFPFTAVVTFGDTKKVPFLPLYPKKGGEWDKQYNLQYMPKLFPMAPHFQRWCRLLCTRLQSYNGDDNICENDRAKQSCKSLNCLLVTIPRTSRRQLWQHKGDKMET